MSATAQQMRETKEKITPWSVKGVPQDVRDLLKEMAENRRLTVGEMLIEVIHWHAKDGSTIRKPKADSEANSTQDIPRKLDQLSHVIAQMVHRIETQLSDESGT